MAHADISGQFRILVVDDFEPWRQHVCSLLSTRPELCVVAEAADGLEAVHKAKECEPDLILLDIGLPGLNGLEAMNRIRQIIPGIKIVFLTQNDDKDIIRRALQAGAQGYILKTDAKGQLLSALVEVCAGRKFVSSGIDTGESEKT